MKKILSVAIALVVLVSLFAVIPASAADVNLKAKANTATVDGTVASGEYGEAFVMSKANGASWAEAELAGTYTYNFAWDAEGLYVAVSYDKSVLEGAPMVQFGMTPVDKASMPADNQVLFYTLQASADETSMSVTQHHHNTNLADANSNIADKTSAAIKVNGNIVTMEAKIPVASFQIKNVSENFAMAAGNIAASVFVVELNAAGAASATGTTAPILDNWMAPNVTLNTISLTAAGNSNTGDVSMIIVVAVAALALAVVMKKKVVA